jgi:predicted acylesterase/phospholipase RssA
MAMASLYWLTTWFALFYSSEAHQLLNFKGGGIYYYWHAGFCQYLQEIKAPMLNTPVMGASAGSLSAALLLCDTDFNAATAFVVDQAERNELFTKKKSLAFIWGDLVDEWLDFLIPETLPAVATDKLYVQLTSIKPWRRPELVSGFASKTQLKEALMASVHIPFFLNGRPYTKYQGRRFVDGSLSSFVTTSERVRPLPLGLAHDIDDIYTVDYNKDVHFLEQQAGTSFVSMVSPTGLYDMMDSGYAFAKSEYEKGLLFPK